VREPLGSANVGKLRMGKCDILLIIHLS
jgi:hypothetical protein